MLNSFHIQNTKVVRTTLTSIVFFISYNIFSPYLTPFLLLKGFNKEEISFIAAVSYISIIFLATISGRVSDIIGRKKMINFSMILLILSMVTYIVMGKSYELLFIAATLSAIAFEIFSSTTFDRIEDNLEEKIRGKFTGIYESLRSLGALTGILIGTIIITQVKLATVFEVSLSLFVLILIFGLLRKNDNHNIFSRSDFDFIREIKEYWSIRGLRGMAIIGIAKNFGSAAATIFVPLLIIQEFHANLGYIGLFVGAISLSQLTQFYFGKACDVRGSAKINLISMTLYSISISLLFFATSPVMIIAIGLLMGMSLSAWNVSADCVLASIGERVSKEGQIMGGYASFAYVGVVTGYLASGYLSTAVNTRSVFLLYGAVGVISVIIASRYMLEKEI